MVTKILVDSGKYGVVQTGDYSTGTIPNPSQVLFPKYIVCGVQGSTYGIAYWDGESAYSPVFNQNDPRVKNWALICSSIVSGRVFMFSFGTVSNNKSMMYVFELDQIDIKSGTFNPKTTLLYSAVLTGTIDVESLLNIPLVGDDVFFIRTSAECVSVGLTSGAIFIKRLAITTTGCRHNGYSHHVLLINGSVLYILDVETMTSVQVAPSGGLPVEMGRWWPVSDGYYAFDKHSGPTPQVVGDLYEELIGGVWTTVASYPVTSYLLTYKIGFNGVAVTTYDNGVVEVTPPIITDLSFSDNSLVWHTVRRTQSAALNPLPLDSYSSYRHFGAGGDNYPSLFSLEFIDTRPATTGGPVYYYNVDAGPSSASDFKSKVLDYRAVDTGSGSETSYTYRVEVSQKLAISGARQLNVPMTYDTIIALHNPAWGSSVFKAKNEKYGIYSMGTTFSVLYYITPI